MAPSNKRENTLKNETLSINTPPRLDQNELKKLEALFEAKRYEELEARVLQHINQFPSAFFLYNILGLTQAGLEKFAEAATSYQKVLSFQPDHAGALCNMGMALLNLGYFEKSIEHYKKALEADSRLQGVHKNIGVALNNLGQFEEAVPYYQEALKENPKDDEIHRNLGIAYDNLGQTDKAISHYEDALKLKPESLHNLHRLGMVFMKAERLEDAAVYLGKALQVEPNNYELQINLGTVFNNLEKFDDAVVCFSKAIELNPSYPKAYSSLGSTYQNMEQYDDALRYFDKALELEPNNAETHYRKGLAYDETNQNSQAIESFQKALEIKPDYLDALCRLGAVFNKVNRDDEALECYDRAVELAPDKAKTHYFLGYGYMKLERPEAAIESYDKALQLKADFTNAYINKATAYRKLENDYKAAQIYQQAIESDPNSDVALRLFADTVRRLRKVKHTPNLRKHVISCFRHPTISSIAVTPVANNILRGDLEALLEGGAPDIETIAGLNDLTEEFLPAYLKYTLVTDCELEKFLTGARASLLRFHHEKGGEPEERSDAFPILEGLAFQGFRNEYSWYVTQDERDLLKELVSTIDGRIADGNAPLPGELYLLAAYSSLHSFEKIREWGMSAYENAEPGLKQLLKRQIVEPEREAVISQDLEPITSIDDDVSVAVRSQYEENPYPRWDNISVFLPELYTWRIAEELDLSGSPLEPTSDAPEVLVAGCGTGRQPIISAHRYKNSNVLAVDLSRASLSYAKRKADEMGISNLRFGQADILKLGELKQQFDVIECSGVLHHMKEPERGLEVLLGLLKPGGYLKLALYSKLARQAMSEFRNRHSGQQVDASTAAIQALRRNLLNDEPELAKNFTISNDFYTTSTVRDLLLHVQEHLFTVPQIADILDTYSLEFIGFAMADPQVKQTYKQMYPDDPDCIDLKHWNAFEELNPSTFIRMYQFWCKYNPQK